MTKKYDPEMIAAFRRAWCEACRRNDVSEEAIARLAESSDEFIAVFIEAQEIVDRAKIERDKTLARFKGYVEWNRRMPDADFELLKDCLEAEAEAIDARAKAALDRLPKKFKEGEEK